jgi:hypothetical protein
MPGLFRAQGGHRYTPGVALHQWDLAQFAGSKSCGVDSEHRGKVLWWAGIYSWGLSGKNAEFESVLAEGCDYCGMYAIFC